MPMEHDFRLYVSSGRAWAYCGCGWLGRAWNADMPEKCQHDYRRHLVVELELEPQPVDIDVDVLRAIEGSIARAAWWTPPVPDLEQWDPEKRTAYEIERWKAEGFYWWTESVAKPLFRTILAAMHSPAAARPPDTPDQETG